MGNFIYGVTFGAIASQLAGPASDNVILGYGAASVVIMLFQFFTRKR